MAALEGQQVAGLVFDLLKADTAFSAAVGGRVYRDMVPQAATLPAATVTLVSHTDGNTLAGRRVLATTLVDVRVVGAGTSYQNTAAGRADDVLQSARGARNGVNVVALRRETLTAYVETEAGATFAHIVQTYRTEAYAAP